MRRFLPLAALAFLVMAAFGGLDNIRGVLIPAIRADLSLSYTALAVALFLGSLAFLAGIYSGGQAVQSYGNKSLLATGLCLVGVAQLFVLGVRSYPTFVLFIVVFNLGIGLFEIGLNALGARLFRERAATGMSILHLFFGLGSVLGAQYAGALIVTEAGWQEVFAFPAVLVGSLLVWTLLMRFGAAGTPEQGEGERTGVVRTLRDGLVRRLAVLLGLIIGIEMGLASWLVNYLVETRGMDESTAAHYFSGFYGTFTAGRLLLGILSEKLGYTRTIALLAIGAGAAVLAGLVIPGVPWLFAVSGAFVSILYPTVMGIVIHQFPRNTGTVMGGVLLPAVVVTSIGNSLVGVLHDLLGVQLGFASLLLYPVAIALLAGSTAKEIARRRAGAAEAPAAPVTAGLEGRQG